MREIVCIGRGQLEGAPAGIELIRADWDQGVGDDEWGLI